MGVPQEKEGALHYGETILSVPRLWLHKEQDHCLCSLKPYNESLYFIEETIYAQPSRQDDWESN